MVQGATYPNIKAVKDAVRMWAISLKQECRVVKSCSKEYEVKCVNAGCPWRVHAFKGRWKSNWKCSIEKFSYHITIYHATLLQSKYMG